MKTISIYDKAGAFAENKDVAREIRINEIIPSFEKNESLVLNFDRVEGVTQSFIHALISDVIRRYGNTTLDRISFQSCNETVKKIIYIVVEYMQEGMGFESAE